MKKINFFEKLKHFFFHNSKMVLPILFLALSVTTAVLASPPTSPYYPTDNATDPSCAPGDANCYVSTFPDQTGHGGQFLTTNGTTVGWGDVDLSNLNVTYTPSGSTTATAGGLTSGTDLGTSALTLQSLLDRVFYAATNPSATLSASSPTREFGSSNAVTLSWTATKNTGTPTITAIAITANNSGTTGSAVSPTGNTQSGSNAGTVVQDTASTTTFTLTVTAGSRSATTTATVNYRSKFYYGVSSVASAVDGSGTAITDAQIRGLANSPLSTARTLSATTFSPSSQYVYFAWPASFEPVGGCNAVDITSTSTTVGTTNCFFQGSTPITDFLVETRTFTNASGYSSSYKVYRSANLLSGSVAYSVQ